MGKARLTATKEAPVATSSETANADLQPASAKKASYQEKPACAGGKLIRGVPFKLTPATMIKGAARNTATRARNRKRAPREMMDSFVTIRESRPVGGWPRR